MRLGEGWNPLPSPRASLPLSLPRVVRLASADVDVSEGFLNCVLRRRQTGLSVPSYTAGKEADRSNQTALMEMTLYIYTNTPLESGR